MPSDNSTFEQAVEALYHLNVGVIGTGAERHERPHKPLLLLAVLDLISSALQTFGTARVQDGARVRDLGSGPPLAPFQSLAVNSLQVSGAAVSQSPPSLRRHVSRILDARRSLGEAELHGLKDRPILLPHDEAFLPSQEALAWRLERLAA